MKILKPDLPENLLIIEGLEALMLIESAQAEDEDIEKLRIVGAFLDDAELEAVTFKECYFDNCHFIGCEMEKVSFVLTTEENGKTG